MMPQSSEPKILFVSPSSFYFPEWMERVQIKSSQLLLASYIEQFYPVEYADFEITIGRPNTPIQIRRFERHAREFLSKTQFDILAISCWTSLSYQASLATARICRSLHPEKIIVVGGYHPSARPNEFVTPDRLFDFVITGEGEFALKRIADNFEAGRPSRPTVLDGGLFTVEHFVPVNWVLVRDFVSRNFPEGIPIAYVYLSRGCPFSCSFCMESLKSHKWRAYTPADSVQILFDSVENLKSQSVAIADACFGMNGRWRKEFLRRLVDANPSFWIALETRPEFIDEEDIKMLSHLKVEVQIGVESCSERMLSIMNKTRQAGRFLEKFRETSHLLSKYGVLHRANLIFNHPGETLQTLEESFAFMDKELDRQDSTLFFWAAHQYMHFPGCACDVKRKVFENEYGTQFLAAEWWKEAVDQYENCMKNIPSREFTNGNLDLWQQMLLDREERMKSCLSPKAFRFAANQHFRHWKDDPRYQQV
jgi:radical SAM superfamily enzyme YgiQ (UPF0313 family)